MFFWYIRWRKYHRWSSKCTNRLQYSDIQSTSPDGSIGIGYRLLYNNTLTTISLLGMTGFSITSGGSNTIMGYLIYYILQPT